MHSHMRMSVRVKHKNVHIYIYIHDTPRLTYEKRDENINSTYSTVYEVEVAKIKVDCNTSYS